jgi:hypothetical protein
MALEPRFKLAESHFMSRCRRFDRNPKMRGRTNSAWREPAAPEFSNSKRGGLKQ